MVNGWDPRFAKWRAGCLVVLTLSILGTVWALVQSFRWLFL